MTETFKMDIQAIMRLLPHRYPFLLVDRVLECAPGEYVRALKNVTFNEPFFPGHFPHRPIMPGVLIVEALAQVSGILAFTTAKVTAYTDAHFYFVGIDKARFRKPVEPGDQLILVVNLERNFKGIYRFATRAEVGGEEVANAQIMIAPDLDSVPAKPAPTTPAPTTSAPSTTAPADLP